MNKTTYMLVKRNATMKVYNGVSCPLEYRYYTVVESHGNIYEHGNDIVYEEYLLEMPTRKLAEFDIYEVKVLGDLVASRRGVFKTNKLEIVRKLYEKDRNKMFKENDRNVAERRAEKYTKMMTTIGEATVKTVVAAGTTALLKKLLK